MTKISTTIGLFATASLLLAACGDDSGGTCPPGTVDCPCGPDATCIGEDLFCAGGICRAPSCALGELGCACFANETCSMGSDGRWLVCQNGICERESCPPGSLGCGCLPGFVCNGGYVCSTEGGSPECEIPGCSQGDLDCGCYPDRTCNVDTASGTPLVCDGNLCVLPDCEVGSNGCLCRPDYSCDEPLVCGDGNLCGAPGCTRGDLSCPCLPDRTCNDDAHSCAEDRTCQISTCPQGDEGCGCFSDFTCAETDDETVLLCQHGVCVEAVDDPEGQTGGPCFSNGTCVTGNRCVDDVCVECALGTSDCACYSNETCDPGLVCMAGRCIDESALLLEPPDDPVCYSPCSEDYTASDGTFQPCSADGLIVGCLGTTECNNGSCVVPGDDPPACASELDCPDFQTCIRNGCYSTCALDSDCAGGTSCYRAVCRVPCNASGDACDPQYYCRTVDGEDGFCMPLAATFDDPDPVEERGFEVSTELLEFTNNRVTAIFTITNHTDRPLDFTVRKLEHTEYHPDGRVTVTTHPLSWLAMGPEDGDILPVEEVVVDVLGDGGETTIVIDDAYNAELDRWEGRLEIHSETLGSQFVHLNYASLPEGQWIGTIYYFINFDDVEIDAWRTDPTNWEAANDTENALLVKWTDFRTNALFSLAEWLAVVRATVTGSWSYAGVQQACDELFSGVFGHPPECYLYASGEADDLGIKVFTTEPLAVRIPTGVVEMPFSVNLQRVATENLLDYTGRIESSLALQYPGNPEVHLGFATNPEDCESDGEACLVPISDFGATILVGGRYLPDVDDVDCAFGEGRYELVDIPWLVPHFTQGTVTVDGVRVRPECREGGFPVDPEARWALELNTSFAESNPIPDGRARVREIELLDGVLINQDTLFLIIREQFTSFLDVAGGQEASFFAYGVVRLERAGVNLSEDDFIPGVTPDPASLPEPSGLLELSCSDDLVEQALGEGVELNSESAATFARVLLSGIDDGGGESPALVDGDDAWTVHYLCHDTGRFDGGPTAWIEDDLSGPEPCPAGSGVTFFLIDSTEWPDGIEVGDHPCQGSVRCPVGEECPLDTRGQCAQTLADWEAEGTYGVEVDPVWSCDVNGDLVRDDDTVFCEDDRTDLRADRIFYEPYQVTAVFEPLRPAINTAFRYKTRFRSRSGRSVGFVPSVCEPDSDILPYCFDPGAIEAIRERVDCLVHVYMTYELETADFDLFVDVQDFLEDDFSFYYWPPPGDGGVPTELPYDGFERLYAELLVMLGDDALTRAVASRFDLAGSSVAAFEGDLLEPNGIRLSGGAGYEMQLLYRATQYYQLVLDRFYRLSPTIWEVLPDDRLNFITLDAITTYFDRLILASTKKAQAASEIAERYLGFNRPDLARHTIERMYTQAYLESIAISQFMRRAIAVLDPNEIPALQAALDDAQRRFRVALRQMREDYQNITDELTVFGFSPDYIPFPVLWPRDRNAVQVMLDRAFETVRIAAERETHAIESTRAFDLDEAAFQSELTRVRNQYENELAELCGTFRYITEEGDDGEVYPAIPKYAYLNGVFMMVGDPCGFVDNGQIHEAMGEVDLARIDLATAVRAIEEILEEIEIERQRGLDECAGRLDIASLRFATAGEVITLQTEIADLQHQIEDWHRELALIDRGLATLQSTVDMIGQITMNVSACTPKLEGIPPVPVFNAIGCATSTAASAASATSVAHNLAATGEQWLTDRSIADTELDIAEKERQMRDIQRTADFGAALMQCCLDDLSACDAAYDVCCDAERPAEECDSDYMTCVATQFAPCEHPGPLLVDSEARIDSLMTGLQRAELTALRAELSTRLAMGRLSSLWDRADRLIAQQEEAEHLLINLEAARNDPNIRIYRNTAVLDADRSFEYALVDAYRVTRVFEYYTAQSYAPLSELFLARMVSRGDYNLENYLIDLERELRDFEESFGIPATRVAEISLRDDIFHVPETDESGRALSQRERMDLFRQELTDVSYLDQRGYTTIPFATPLDMTSPLTAIHKILRVEAEIIGSDVGDRVGRIYLTQRGTGSVRGLDELETFYRFPPLTAVVNPFFNGVRIFDPDVYENQRLRDRPFANTLWELGINQRDEEVNRDINLESLTDVRLYIYYTDFTVLE